MKKIIRFIIPTVCIIVVMGVLSYAGTSYSKYNTTVGRFNGNGYTGFQKKAWSGANGVLKSSSVGGGYHVDARMIDTKGHVGKWTRRVNSKRTYTLGGNSKHRKGKSVRVQFSNDLTTPVAVQVTGKWKSN